MKLPSLVSPDIVQDCSLGQCLRASRSEISKKVLGQNWDRNDPFCCNVVELQLKFAYYSVNTIQFNALIPRMSGLLDNTESKKHLENYEMWIRIPASRFSTKIL